jgi:uncharacterized protein YqhQ
MMRTPDRWAVAVRRPDGGVHTERHDVEPPSGTVFLRGPASIFQSVGIGTRALRIALRIGTGAEPTAEQLGVTFGAGIVALVAIFIVAPGLFLADVRGLAGPALEATARAAMLLLYLTFVSRSPQTQRLFRFHGAEHKTIAAFERSGALPSRETTRLMSPVHERCGSTFISLFVIGAGILYAFVPRSPLWLGALLRIVLVPVLIALCYELMRAAARERDALWSRAVTFPGRTLQRITTREPDEDELDVAFAALATLLD